MEIEWQDSAIPDGPFFTRDVYDEVGFAPSVQELFSFLQRPQKRENTPPSVTEASLKENCCESEDSSMETEESKCVEEMKKSPKTEVAFPEPRLPYPCMSALSQEEQRRCINCLHTKKKLRLPEILYNKMHNEVAQFMMYLQDVSWRCTEDYNVISKDALQYSEEVFRNWLEYIKTLPESYQIHELTSLTGGKFNPALTLTCEKELLHMGTVIMTHLKPVPVDRVLASDYLTVSSHTPPAKKAKTLHASISNDKNAERLCNKYEPHVCLTKEALVRLLNNHGPEFREEWELPVLIKSNPSTEKSRKKAIYIDAPLMKSEVTIRERSHMYHEEILKLSAVCTEIKNVHDVTSELPWSKAPVFGGNVTNLKNDSIDFEVDLSDLETFGESISSKATAIKKNMKNKDAAGVKSDKVTSETKSSSLDEEIDSNQCEMVQNKDAGKVATPQNKNCDQESTGRHMFGLDSDDEDKLIIADCSPNDSGQQKDRVSPNSASPSKTKRAKVKKKTPPSGDQLGEILQMQTAMFTSTPSNTQPRSSSVPQESSSPPKQSGRSHLQPTSLVKACVSSYLERNPTQEEETGDVIRNVAAPESAGVKTAHLSQDLLAASEDEHDFECPEEGNVFYKLYCLDELLLMVRSSISFSRNVQHKCVPFTVFPKLEYQLMYGVEYLSSSEVCQLWTETLLHSSTDTCIAHVDAFTPRVAMVRKLSQDWIYNVHCSFNPSKSLNILHHILQKLTGLDEGQYLLRHKVGEPFVNILKAAHGNGRQGVYNLQQIHSDIPPPPTSAVVPWIPVDPSVCLPFHRKHGRVPCTFPPKEFTPPPPSHKRGTQPGKKKPKKKPKKKK